MEFLLIFLTGTAMGSFLNVCITRLPEEKSIVLPGSHCPKCRTPIAWYDNIPLWSYLRLRGLCRACQARIPFRYFLVELVSGLLWLGLWAAGFRGWFLTVTVVFLSLLLAVSVTDFESGLIPDPLTLAGGLVGVGWSVTQGALIKSLAGLALGYLVIYLLGIFGRLVFRKESMGGGDMKLMAMMGSFLGPRVLFVVWIAAVIALPYALWAKWMRRAETIPFGPFLALAGAGIYLLT